MANTTVETIYTMNSNFDFKFNEFYLSGVGHESKVNITKDNVITSPVLVRSNLTL